MNQELKLAIGEIGISIRWEGSRIIGWPHPAYEKFITDTKPKISLDVLCQGLPRHSSRLLFDGKAEGNWRLYQNNSGYIIETFDTLTRKKNKVCFVSPDFRKCEVYVDPRLERFHTLRKIFRRHTSWSFPLLMQPLGQLLLVNVLADEGGFMAHGLGINDRGKGIAFLGGSGTGKSTLAGYWEGQEKVNILSDEHIIIRKKDGQFLLYGTPWPGMAMAASSESVALDHIFFIEHATENKILGQGSTGDLMPHLFLPFWDKERLNIVLEFCEDLFKTLKWKKLGFSKDKSVVEFVRRGQEA
ncbi:MAG: hypothetical protein ACETWK_03295 [Candidatus Aminicenantaceae bacterium]